MELFQLVEFAIVCIDVKLNKRYDSNTTVTLLLKLFHGPY
jgi:hypothetical protein